MSTGVGSMVRLIIFTVGEEPLVTVLTNRPREERERDLEPGGNRKRFLEDLWAARAQFKSSSMASRPWETGSPGIEDGGAAEPELGAVLHSIIATAQQFESCVE